VEIGLNGHASKEPMVSVRPHIVVENNYARWSNGDTQLIHIKIAARKPGDK
jgi:hypothetical protein